MEAIEAWRVRLTIEQEFMAMLKRGELLPTLNKDGSLCFRLNEKILDEPHEVETTTIAERITHVFPGKSKQEKGLLLDVEGPPDLRGF